MRSQTAIEYLLSVNEAILFALVIVVAIVGIGWMAARAAGIEDPFLRRLIP